MDYAKIANLIELRPDLSKLIVNYNYPFKEKYTKLAAIPTTAGSGARLHQMLLFMLMVLNIHLKAVAVTGLFSYAEFLTSAPIM